MYVLPLLLPSKMIIIQVRVSLVVSRLALINSALFPMVHSNPIQISLPDLSVCASSGCGFTMSTTFVDNATFFDGTYPGGIETIVTPCALGVLSTRSHICANGLNVTAVCSGQSNVSVTSNCPTVISRPGCGRLISSSVVNDVCTLSSYTPTQTTCACTVPVSTLMNGRRRLTDIPGTLQVGAIDTQSTVTPQIIVANPSYLPTTSPSIGM
jgi:hypothetical protein